MIALLSEGDIHAFALDTSYGIVEDTQKCMPMKLSEHVLKFLQVEKVER